MAGETIAQVEDAIIAALKPLDYLRALETYQGQLTEATLDEIVTRLAVNFPAALVLYLGSRLEESPTYLYGDVQTWGVYVAAKNLRGEKEARRGGAAAVGTYEMIEGVKKQLTGNALGLSIQPLSLKAIDSILVEDGLSVYGLTFETLLDYEATAKAGPV